MATKKCAREECGKTVYPMEELNCLDKIWHKGCFRCTHCSMALNMKNYKGYNKMPYCEPHYPKVVATVITDTPENQRVAANTRLQSQNIYHADYEKMKGKKIDLATTDDPEISRVIQNTKTQSNIQYHGEHEKKKAQEASRPTEEEKKSVKLSEASIHVSAVDVESPTYALKFDHTNLYDNNASQNEVHANHQHDYNLNNNKENFATTIWSSNLSKDPAPVKVGSIADYDPLAAEKKAEESTKGTNANKAGGDSSIKKGTKKTKTTGYSVKALYDYTAADSDEISFKEGDVIVNCQAVDEGWLTGTHQKTLVNGMLPANYVEKIIEKTGQFRMS